VGVVFVYRNCFRSILALDEIYKGIKSKNVVRSKLDLAG
jgi:hypothetical protein